MQMDTYGRDFFILSLFTVSILAWHEKLSSHQSPVPEYLLGVKPSVTPPIALLPKLDIKLNVW